ncbi:MAG: hypothetical protein ACE5FY_03285 [Nitrospiria bacterium]
MRSLLFLFIGMALLSGCGVSLGNTQSAGDDPVTSMRKDVHRLNIQHGNLRKELLKNASQLKSEIKGLQEQDRKTLTDLSERFGERSAAMGERITQLESQNRLLRGTIEEERHRFKELFHQENDHILKEVNKIRTLLAKQGKDGETIKKVLQKQINVQEKQGTAHGALAAQLNRFKNVQETFNNTISEKMNALQSDNRAAQGASDSLANELEESSKQMTAFTEKLLPAVNGLASRLDNLEWKFEKFEGEFDINSLNKRLMELSDAIDVQRQSLEMLGDNLSAQISKLNKQIHKQTKQSK